jgi:deoxyribodipyrimidine photolyase
VPDNDNPEQTDPSSNIENTRADQAQKLIEPVKTPASKNALVHGLYAADILLPWESEEEFETLFRELQEEWRPRGRQEMETVLSLARANFLKHRLMRSTQIVFRSDPLAAEVEQGGATSWREIAALMQKHATDQEAFEQDIRSASQALATAWHTVCDSMTAPDKDSREINDTVKQMYMDYMPLYKKLLERLKQKNPDITNPNHPKPYIDRPRTLAEQAYYPDYLEKLMKLEASIDTRIDKLLHRLVTLQEYRRLNETKTIAAPASSQD